MMQIIPFSAEHHDAVGPFVLSVQHEHGVPITLADQPDLANIENHYIAPGGNFWVALHDGKLVATAALLYLNQHIVIMRKLFVAPQFRGAPHQLGKQLLEVMVNWARENGFTKLYLGTVAVFTAACRFYEKHGFTRLSEAELPPEVRAAKMRVDDTFYMMELRA